MSSSRWVPVLLLACVVSAAPDDDKEAQAEAWKLFSIRGATIFVALGIITMPRSIVAALCVVLMIAVPLVVIAFLAVMLRFTTAEAIHSLVPWEQWPRVLLLYVTLLISALLVSYRMHVRTRRERLRGGAARLVIDPPGDGGGPATTVLDLPQLRRPEPSGWPSPTYAWSQAQGSMRGYATLPS
jgi:hypothetical protein